MYNLRFWNYTKIRKAVHDEQLFLFLSYNSNVFRQHNFYSNLRNNKCNYFAPAISKS